MAKYLAYPDYNTSEVEWLDSVPSHWDVQPLKFMTSSKVTDGPHETPKFTESGVPFLSVDGIQNNKLVFEGCRYISIEDHERFKIKCCPKVGDVLLGKAASVGKVAYVDSDIEFNVWSPLAVITPKKLSLGKYLYYCFQSSLLQVQCEVYSNANTQKNLGMSVIDNLMFAVAPENEAIKIANFLDHETAKIDTLIEQQQKLIQLLKEKRQAVISHAVTKGLSSLNGGPNAPMKDSGVEWLGEVPAHWVCKSYRYACQIYRGKFGHRPRNDPAFYDGDYPFIQTGDVAQAGKYITEYKQTLNEKGKAVSQLFPAGTLVMTIAANIGDTAILGFEAYAPDSIVGFKPKEEIDLEFLRYSLMAALPALVQTSTQSTQANLNIERVGAVQAAFPTKLEQQEIVKFIDEMLNKFNSIEAQALSGVEILQERRTALISAAVTGKIDVRNWQAPQQ